MEPDVRTLLTQKIREAEQEPVTWNKAAVWMKVQNRVSPQADRPTHYYVAAGITFLLFGTLFLWQQNQTLPVEKTRVEKKPIETPAVENAATAENKVKESTVEKKHEQSSVHTLSEKPLVVNVEELPVLVTTELEDVVIPVEIVEEHPVTSISAEESIQAIVGVVIREEQKRMASTKTKRKKLRTLEPLDNSKIEPANLILARIK